MGLLGLLCLLGQLKQPTARLVDSLLTVRLDQRCIELAGCILRLLTEAASTALAGCFVVTEGHLTVARDHQPDWGVIPRGDDCLLDILPPLRRTVHLLE